MAGSVTVSRHLSEGDDQPLKIGGKVCLYSMKYCPFAHRVRLTLSYKNIPHEIVNINLKNKPHWYKEINPEEKVPALVDVDGNIVVDSTTIVNYLEEKYPDPPLYNSETIKRDLELLDEFSKIVKIFSNCIHKKLDTTLQKAIEEIFRILKEFEEELKTRKTTFFGGDRVGMLDILMWPFVERAKAISVIYNETVEFNKEEFPEISKWIAKMKEQEFVQINSDSYEKFAKVVEASNEGSVDYDNI